MSNYIVCERCSGTGFIEITDPASMEIEDECPDCEAYGQLDSLGYAPLYAKEQAEL